MSTRYLFLNSVKRPSRYVAGEFNRKRIDPTAPVRWCFAFPDVYEIGMSFTGLQILYGLLNESENSSCERVFAPWIDAEHRLRELGEPLRSLETEASLLDFDIIGFSLQHEMNYTNVLTILDLGGIPLLQKNRDRRHPLVIGGGSCTFNGEPMADFFDAYVIGDGEETVLEINALLREMPVHETDRETLLRALAGIPGVYVPSLIEVRYNPDGTVCGFRNRYEEIPFPVEARKVQLNGAYLDTAPMVPSAETVHDRAAIEVLRGCTRGCRFCQAGYITRPIRERPSKELVRLSREMLRNTGFDNLSLLSLSTADHKDLPGIVDGLLDDEWDPTIGISLPSLRIDGFDLRVATRLAELHQSGFTFAPEAGTKRLRKVISKDLGDREIFSTLEGVFQRGWKTIKLYFQMGLPTETYEDLDGIIRMVRDVQNLMRKKGVRRPKLNVSCNPHVPKPFTPFQWFGQEDIPTLKEKARYLKKNLPGGSVKFSYHDPELSFLEGVMSRGDRKVGKAILRAWELGCRFDDWNETFDFSRWLQAFEETGIDPTFYSQRTRDESEIFPWETVSCGVTRGYFLLEWHRALKAKATYDCRDRRTCTLCGICDEDYRHDLYPPGENRMEGPPLSRLGLGSSRLPEKEGPETQPAEQPNVPPARYEGLRRPFRIEFSKTGVARWLSQLDLQRTLIQTFRRAGIPLAPSEGFNPRPKISFAMALPVGTECYSEWAEVVLRDDGDLPDVDEWVRRLNEAAPPGIRIRKAYFPDGERSLTQNAHALEAEVHWIPETPRRDRILRSLERGLARYSEKGDLKVRRPAQGRHPEKEIDLARFVDRIEIRRENGSFHLWMLLHVDAGRTARPDEVAQALCAPLTLEKPYLDIRRLGIRLRTPEPQPFSVEQPVEKGSCSRLLDSRCGRE